MFDVITIGTATQDVFIQSMLFRVMKGDMFTRHAGFPTGEAECFALGGKLEIDRPLLSVGGGAANAAVTFARQGFKTAALYKVGHDEFGQIIFRTLRREGVTSFAIEDKHAGTAYSTILSAPNGERTILTYRGASAHMTYDEVPVSRFDARAYYIAPGKIPMNVMMQIIARVKKTGACIAMNPSKHYLGFGLTRLASLFRMLDVVIVNREEASLLTGLPFPSEKQIFKMFDDHVPGLAVMMDGPRGVVVSDNTILYRAGIFKEKEIVDRTGAGDAFGSGFLAGLLRGGRGKWTEADIEYGIRLGSANATSVVEHIGAQAGIMTRKEFESGSRWKRLRIQYSKV